MPETQFDYVVDVTTPMNLIYGDRLGILGGEIYRLPPRPPAHVVGAPPPPSPLFASPLPPIHAPRPPIPNLDEIEARFKERGPSRTREIANSFGLEKKSDERSEFCNRVTRLREQKRLVNLPGTNFYKVPESPVG